MTGLCRAESTLPPILAALALTFGPSTPEDLNPELVCVLGEHPDEPDHWGFACEIDGDHTGEVWTRWTDELPPYVVLVKPNCPSKGPEDFAFCGMFAEHPGPCTWEIELPTPDKLRALERDFDDALTLLRALGQLDPPP
ncbi:hypothetical protein GCM10010329_84870 [Streptomyces spiroverticillatus]|uniref:Uncharacterized protein n=2 Tax=Streptomyces finlayi TaxID=67296 RepID=A0A918X9M4_9ACTN|nr:hypothetical protein GCM10010329_84870 [Streptomyces spiroverticillatus]GHD19665.1 hypothetical protein GCM10010334_83560 [Streptomyces finlayi]